MLCNALLSPAGTNAGAKVIQFLEPASASWIKFSKYDIFKKVIEALMGSLYEMG